MKGLLCRLERQAGARLMLTWAISVCLLVCRSSNAVDAVSVRECTDAEAIEAEKSLDQLVDWTHVRNAFLRFGHCDDGAIGEGWSAAVVRLLTTKWETTAQLARLTATDKKFFDFVVGHVDELMSPDESHLIIANAHTKCPRSARRLCRAIEGKARKPSE